MKQCYAYVFRGVLVIGAGITARYFAAKGFDGFGQSIAGAVYDRNTSWIPF